MAVYNLKKSQDNISLISQKMYKLNFQNQHKLCNLLLQKLFKLIQNTGSKICLCYVYENYLLVICTTYNIFKAQFICLLDNYQNGSALQFRIIVVGRDPQDWAQLLTDQPDHGIGCHIQSWPEHICLQTEESFISQQKIWQDTDNKYCICLSIIPSILLRVSL